MRIKSIIFIYPMKLSERQENILIVNLRAIKKKAIEDMENASKNLLNSNMKFIAKDQFEMISTKLDIVSKMARSEMKLEKDSDTRWRFSYPDEDFTGMSFDFHGKHFQLGHVMPKKVLVKFITNAVARDMGIKPGTVTWEEEEKDL